MAEVAGCQRWNCFCLNTQTGELYPLGLKIADPRFSNGGGVG